MTHKLLLADDSVTIQRVVELTFSGEDVQVVTVGDGEQAIARIPELLPDVVLADIGMPKRSGYEVAAFVKGRPDLAHIPVLLLAGAFEPVDEARAQQVRSDGVLVKPFEPQQVISRVRELIGGGKGVAPRPPVAQEPPVPHPEAERSIAEPRSASLEAATSSPEATAKEPEPRGLSPEPRLDDYFDRLDAAFAQLGSELERPVMPRSIGPEEDDRREVPTMDRVLAASRQQHAGSGAAPMLARDTPAGGLPALASSAEPTGGRNLVADMFAALFAVEQGEAGALPVPVATPRPEAPLVTEGLVDEVTRRVIERLAPDTARELVTQIVSDVAERLVREEIARIKSAVGSRH